MTVVADASVAVKLFVTETHSDAARRLFATESVIAPDLLVPEVANVAWRKVVQDDLSLADALEIMRRLPGLFDELVSSLILAEDALRLATQLSHPAYDCFYLALAMSRDVRMVTADTRLLRRTGGAAVSPAVIALHAV